MGDRMAFRANLVAMSLAGLGLALSTGSPFRDDFGREYVPAPRGVKREGPARRQGTFTRQRTICRRAMALRRHIDHAEVPASGAIRSRHSSRRVNVQRRPVSASLAAWRAEQPRLASIGLILGRPVWC